MLEHRLRLLRRAFTHPGGAVLHVTTVGDTSTVASYGVDCPTGG